jgi:RecB family exonuclease
MQEFWLRVRDQQSLLRFSLAERLAVLDVCIVTALKDAGERARTAWDQAYLEVQRQRLRNLLGPWLELEAQRPPFAVYQQETDLVQVKLGPLIFQKLRIDRIDETAGGRLVIDYKTGAADPRDWRSDRPEQPQVPLYVTLLSEARSGVSHDLQPEDERVSGAAFAVLRPGQELAFKGVADDERVLIRRAPMDGPTFDEQLAEWRRVLTALAVQFAEGQAAVDPRRFPETCKFCGQRLFCRIDPAQINPQAAGPEDESSEAEAAREPEDGAIDFEADFV